MNDELMTNENVAAEMEMLRQENAELRRLQAEAAATTHGLKEKAATMEVVNKFSDWEDPNAAAKLLSENLKLDDGKLGVYGDAGQPLAGPFGRMTPEEYVIEFRERNSWLVRDGGAASRSSQHDNGVALATLFGPKSKGSIANKLAMENPSEYRRLKVLAKEQGLI
jgi:hypothetical protein